jgi:cytochrome bd-type quinol oxidase subunit 2
VVSTLTGDEPAETMDSVPQLVCALDRRPGSSPKGRNLMTTSQKMDRRLAQGSAVMALAAFGFVGYGLVFFARNFSGSFLELGIGPNEVQSSKVQIEAFDEDLFHYIQHLQIALSGFIMAAGLAIAALAWFGVRRGLLWAYVTAVAVPVLALAVAVPAHYPYHLDTIGHLGFSYVVTAIFVVGAALALPSFRRR